MHSLQHFIADDEGFLEATLFFIAFLVLQHEMHMPSSFIGYVPKPLYICIFSALVYLTCLNFTPLSTHNFN